MKEFLELVERLVPLNNCTRWNSWYLSLVVANKLAPSINIYSKDHYSELSQDYLDPQDWKKLRTIMAFLQPFHRATLETQGYRATIDSVLFTMDILVRYFKTSLVSKIFFILFFF